jgi:murein tripeptide amidase MpaA
MIVATGSAIRSTRYENGQLIVEHTPERNSIYYAYFEPYSHERHLDLLGRVEMSPYASVSNLGATVEGVIWISSPSAARGRARLRYGSLRASIPGESMAEWFVEGLLERLLDGADPVARRIREKAVLYIVPNMNPDGAIRGNLRTNAAGANLNREWREPSA